MNKKHRIGKIILALAILLMVMPMAVEAETYRFFESFTMEELSEKRRDGWYWIYLNVYASYSPDLQGVWDTESRFPTVNVPTTLELCCNYGLRKTVQGDTFIFKGGCTQTGVCFDIYKNGVVVDNYVNSTDSKGRVEFTVTFREPGYYGYKAYTLKQKEIYIKYGSSIADEIDVGIPEEIEKFYVEPVQTSTLKPTHLSELAPMPPETTPMPHIETKPIPQVDSDSDGVPDEYDYAPHDPEVQTKSDAKTPGFGAIFAIGGLFAVAYLILRRKGYRI